MNTQLVILIVYVVLLLGLAAWATRLQAKTAARNKMLSYLLTGRNMPAFFVAIMLIGLAVVGASTVGVAQTAYTKGLSADWYNGA